MSDPLKGRPNALDGIMEWLTLPWWASRAVLRNAFGRGGCRRADIRVAGTGKRMACVFPKTGAARPLAVVLLHGGGWSLGWPTIFLFAAYRLARAGYVTYLPAHIGGATYDGMIGNLVGALQQIPARRLVLVGVSSAAQLACHLAQDRALSGGKVAGVVCVGGPMAMQTHCGPMVSWLFRRKVPSEARRRALDPCCLLRSGAQCFYYLLHGRLDTWCPVQGARDFAAIDPSHVRLREAPMRHTAVVGSAFLDDGAMAEGLLNWLEKLPI